MRELLFTLLLILGACGGEGTHYCQPGAPKTDDCDCPEADMAGTQAEICGGPDSLYSPEACGCVGAE